MAWDKYGKAFSRGNAYPFHNPGTDSGDDAFDGLGAMGRQGKRSARFLWGE